MSNEKLTAEALDRADTMRVASNFNEGSRITIHSTRAKQVLETLHRLADALTTADAEIARLRAERDEARASGWREGMEEAAGIADDHTPRKHEATLAAHVTGSTIATAIRSKKDAGQ